VNTSPIGLTIPVAMIRRDDIFLKHLGCYLTTHNQNVEVGTRIFFLVNGDLHREATITAIEYPGDESKFGCVDEEETAKCYKYHWAGEQVTIKVPVSGDKPPVKITVDPEDVDHILSLDWNNIKPNKGNKNKCYLVTRRDGKQVTLGRFLLRQTKPVYQVQVGTDYRKINLKTRHPRCKESSSSPT
jgi:hypothetical protein